MLNNPITKAEETNMMLSFLRIKKISLRIALYFSALLIVIAVAISVFNITIYSDELSEQIDNVVIQKLSLITGRINEKIEDTKSVHSAINNDSTIQNAFQNVYDEPTAKNIQVLTYLIDKHPSLGSDVQTVIALGLNGEIYNPIHTFPAYISITNNNPDFTKMKLEQEYFRFSKPNTFPLEHIDPTPLQQTNITLFAQYFNYEPMTKLGYLAINFRKSFLFDNIEVLAEETFETTYIVNENNEIIYQIGDIPLDAIPIDSIENNTTDQVYLNIGDKTYSVMSSTLPSYYRWRIVTLFDRGIINIETGRLNKFVYLVLFIALIIMFFISWIISQKITLPIREVVSSMKEFEDGNWPQPLETNSEDEVKELILGYNSMLTGFSKLTDDMIERHKENQMIEIDLIKTQTSLLEAQINPHFIHNTLNSMNYLALKEKNHELSAIIESFNKLLRTSMAIDVSFVTITQEIENIKNYALIQQVRFEDAFTIDYSIDPNASIGRIPKLILQPIVENAIIHGIIPSSEIGHIHIRIEKIVEELSICVTDNGIGIEAEVLDELINSTSAPFTSKHIGVQNVIDRIKLYYGESISFKIESTVNEGTTISFKIPYED